MDIVQQGVWDMPLESMPLAAGYMKAAIDSDSGLAGEVDCRIRNFRGGASTDAICTALFQDDVPDVLAFSVFGWNFQSFGILAETFKQLNPGGMVVFGGTHVANQGNRVFRLFPSVDVVVNGEGDFVLRDLVAAWLASEDRAGFGGVPGIAFRSPEGSLVETSATERISDLDTIPSPFLTGAIEMADHTGRFRYDVSLMETNRGCPYRCSFCYWGGAIGQKFRCFSRERLREELAFLAHWKVDTIALCDSNFGMQEADENFLEDFIATRSKHGFPRHLITSWTKNKSKRFYRIVDRMREVGIKGSFTLALQTLDEYALDEMKRKNMKINEWSGLSTWLSERGMEAYAELIWGAPGETVESFLRGYDYLAEHVASIATYPLVILPNTDYSHRRDELGLVTVRGDRDDFEYVLAHKSMSLQDNLRMHKFLFWSRMLTEYMLFRHIWVPLVRLAGITQSAVILSVADWFERSSSAEAAELGPRPGLFDFKQLYESLHRMYAQPGLTELFRQWWTEEIQPRLDDRVRPFLDELFRYDLLTRPLYVAPGSESDLPVDEIGYTEYYRVENEEFGYDIPATVAAVRRGDALPEPGRWSEPLYYRTGFCNHMFSSEEVSRYCGIPDATLRADLDLAGSPPPENSSEPRPPVLELPELSLEVTGRTAE
ncbi:KedN5 family methylcobalamin-dependent radical SAM C-methyltransferase [Amycolatopsis sp. NPDC003676]